MHNRSRKKCFLKDPKEKKPSKTKKTSAQKTTNICIFLKDLVHAVCQKMDIFNLKFLYKTDQEIVFCDGYEGKEAFLDHKNIGSKNHPNLHFFKEVSPWFLSKNIDFLIFSFYAKWKKNNCFLKFPTKRSLLRAKKHRLKKPPKFAFFSNWLVHGFVKKWRSLILSFYAKRYKK